MSDRVWLSADEAKEMLPEGDYVHVFGPNGAMVGSDWDRSTAEKYIDGGKSELSGDMATRMGHGLCVWYEERFWFFETKEEAPMSD